MELKSTSHSYYCSDTNYYVSGNENHGLCEYEDWKSFKEDWLDNTLTIDDDYNHCFRFDIKEIKDDEEEPTGNFELWLFFILQRKGIYRPVWIRNITKEDMPEIEAFLKERWNYLKQQWAEFSE